MISKLLRKLGLIKSTFAITGIAILFSTVLYLISCIFYGGIHVWELIKAAIIPAIVAPIPSYLLLRVAIRLALSEESLWKSEENYRKILESIEEGYFEVDLEGNLTFFNESMHKIAGYPRDELMGMNNREYTAPETAKKMFRLFSEIYRTGKAEKIMHYEIIRKDGSTRILELSSSLMQDSIGIPIGFHGVARDVTEHVRADEALRESEEKYKKLYEKSKRAEEVYRSLLHSSADAIVMYDLEGNTQYISPAFTQIFGWTMEEVKGKQIHFLPDSERAATMAGAKEIMKNGKRIQGFETRRYSKDGCLIDVSISGSRYNDHEGKSAGMLVTLRDISERKKMEIQMHLAQKAEAIGTLAGGIAHDFNNLLMGIEGNTSLMLYDIDSSHPHYRALNNIKQQVKSGAKLTAQLLGYARKGKYKVQPISLNRVVAETGDTFGRARKDITIHRDLSEDLSAIEADQGQVEQVLLNLYINAADAMPDGGDLSLKTMNATYEDMKEKTLDPNSGNYVLLKVTDTGIGMEEEVQKRIFDPFFTTKEMGRGTGLGLASAYGIIKNHGGYLDVQSEKGHGTTFNIYLPASDQKVYAEIEKDNQITEGTGTILLVDDEGMVLDVGAKMLENLGYTVFKARSGNEAIETYEKNKGHIDMVILDMVMPQMAGGEAYDRLKEINPNARVLLSSGYSIDGQAKEILRRGCAGFIQKPFGMEELCGKTREILANR